MKALFLLFAVLAPGIATAAKVEVFKDVTFSICPADAAGCSAQATLQDGRTFLVDQNYASEFLKANGHFEVPEYKDVVVQEVLGVVLREDGHFPNPTAQFDVLKAVKIIP